MNRYPDFLQTIGELSFTKTKKGWFLILHCLTDRSVVYQAGKTETFTQPDKLMVHQRLRLYQYESRMSADGCYNTVFIAYVGLLSTIKNAREVVV